MTIDTETAFRRVNPQNFQTRLRVRPETLSTLSHLGPIDRPNLVLDTNVYIGAVAGVLPEPVRQVLDRSHPFHCSVCLGELLVGVGNADPKDARWARNRDVYADVIKAVPPGRLLVPDAQVWAEAALIAGTLTRSQGYRKEQRLACLNDALIMLTAANAGLPVLTENHADFDLIQQLAPYAQFIHF